MRVTKRVEALLHEIMENGLVFNVRTDTSDNGGGEGARIPLPGTGLSPIVDPQEPQFSGQKSGPRPCTAP